MGYVGMQGQSIDIHRWPRQPMFMESSNAWWRNESMEDRRKSRNTVDHSIWWTSRGGLSWGIVGIWTSSVVRMSTGNSRSFCRQKSRMYGMQFSRRMEILSSLIRPRTSLMCIRSVNCRWMERTSSGLSILDRFSRWICWIGHQIIYRSMVKDIYSSLTGTTAEFICWVLNWRILRFSWSGININSLDRTDFVTYERRNSWSLVRQDL